MSVFVKGMELPIQCASCPMWIIMAAGDVPIDICRAKRIRVDPYRTGRDENCPLVEVPAPHGDLIDRKVIRDNLMHEMFGTGYQSKAMKVCDEYYVPAVIEEEL